MKRRLLTAFMAIAIVVSSILAPINLANASELEDNVDVKSIEDDSLKAEGEDRDADQESNDENDGESHNDKQLDINGKLDNKEMSVESERVESIDENPPLSDEVEEFKKITFHNRDLDYTNKYTQPDHVIIKVEYILNGEKITYDDVLDIGHNQSVTIELPAKASDVNYQVIPKDDFSVVKVTPEKLEGSLESHYIDGNDNITVEILVERDSLRYYSNLETISFNYLESIEGGTIFDLTYSFRTFRTYNNLYYNNADVIKKYIPKGFIFKGWSSTADGSNMVNYPDGTQLADIKEDKLYAIWSRPKEYKFIIQKENPADKSDISFTVKLSDYYYEEKTYNTSTESTLYTPTASKVTDIVVNSDKYEYEVTNPEKSEIDGKFDKYTYIIKIKGYEPVPTGVYDNIIPMVIVLMLASVGLVCGLYKKYTQRGQVL